MKSIFAVFLLVYLNANFALAGWSLGDALQGLGNAASDVLTLGQDGRQRDEAFEQKKAEIAAQEKANQIQKRDAEIANLQSKIAYIQTSLQQSLQLQQSQKTLFDALKNVSALFSTQLSNQVSADLRNQNLQESTEELGKDLNVLRVVLDQVLSPKVQAPVLQVLQAVAESRQLSVADFVARTLEQSQSDKANSILINKQLSQILIDYPTTLAQQNNLMAAQQDDLNTAVARLNAINAGIAAQAAADEQARIQKDQQEKANSEAAQRAMDAAFDREMNRSIAK